MKSQDAYKLFFAIILMSLQLSRCVKCSAA